MIGGCLGRLGLVAVALGAIYAAGLLFVPPVLTATRTTLLLAEMVELPVRPLGLVTAAPTRMTLTYGAQADRLDVYLPAGASPDRPHPAVVLALGVHPRPVDSPDIVRIASAIARSGVVVGVPDSSALRALRLEPTEPANLADAVLALAALVEVDPRRIGLAGFSAGASIALVAAADVRLADRLAYVSAFGGYADVETLLVDVASGSMVLDGEVTPWTPDAGIETDLRALARQAVGTTATRQLFASADRAAAERVIDNVPAATQRLLSAVSPLEHVSAISVPVYLLHGAPDSAIPVSHAHQLAQALGDRVARLTVFGGFGHGQPGATGLGLGDIPDLWALLLHLNAIVAETTE